mgnify:CR=1 FL=1
MTQKRTNIKDVVAGQLPEFVREQYPAFVAFVEAYYEYLEQNSVDLGTVRDIDLTLDSFIQYFKQELAHNYPISSSFDTERYLLKHIKDQYLAKGSEASYKLLFRLLYGKDVYMEYPGKSMLRVSDGRWQQDVSLFVRVEQGDPFALIGKTVDIQTSKKIYRTSVVPGSQRVNKVTANIENVVLFADNIYELFLDRNFYGEIFPGDVVKYQSDFQGQILPNTTKVKIQNKGANFKPGQVFQVSSGEGTPLWFKVLTIETYVNSKGETVEGGLKTIDLIKFGLGYTTDFSITVLPSSAVSTKKKIAKSVVSITYSLTPEVVGKVDMTSGGANYLQVPDVVVGGNGTGATAHAIVVDGEVTEVVIDNQGTGYTTAFINIIAQPGDTGSGAEGEVVLGSNYQYEYSDKTTGFTEGGYLNYGDYWASNYSDGAYVGTIARQFFVDAKDTIAGNPALLNVSLSAVAKYPGYYKTNDGFLDDSMYVQDSYYYQAFSYVIRIDEQLQKYASIVRTMLHPSGMAMFGEYSINNNIALNVALDSLVKSLGVTLYDTFAAEDFCALETSKDLSDSNIDPIDVLQKIIFGKHAEDSVTMTDPSVAFIRVITKNLGFTGQAEHTFAIENGGVRRVDKVFEDVYSGIIENYTRKSTTKAFNDYEPIMEYWTFRLDLNTIDDPLPGVYPEEGYIVKNAYEQGGFFQDVYANSRDSEFSN